MGFGVNGSGWVAPPKVQWAGEVQGDGSLVCELRVAVTVAPGLGPDAAERAAVVAVLAALAEGGDARALLLSLLGPGSPILATARATREDFPCP